jgi:hypothetical protein
MPSTPPLLFSTKWVSDIYNNKNYCLKNVAANTAFITDSPRVHIPDVSNVYIQIEPEIIMPQAQFLIQNWQKYDRILTFHEDVLRLCPNARKYYYGTKWLQPIDYDNVDVGSKQFRVSNIAGSKNIRNAPGHIFRQIIHFSQQRFPVAPPVTFFRSSHQTPHIKDFGGNPFLGDNKIALFKDFQFAIIVENSRQVNYFTEKLMDCLLMKTIPIYFGAPNIGDIFKTNGWILLETGSINELLEKITILTDKHYEQWYDDIEENWHRAHEYLELFSNWDKALV